MVAKIPFLYAIFEELLPFIRGCDLLALALTCKYLKERIFQSKKWNALPFIKDFYHYWNYGMAEIHLNGNISFEQQIMLDKCYEAGLPLEIYFSQVPVDFKINPGSQWMKAVIDIQQFQDIGKHAQYLHLADFDYLVEQGFLPERLKSIIFPSMSGNIENWKRLKKVEMIEIHDLEDLETKIMELNMLPNLISLDITGFSECLYLQPLGNIVLLIIGASGDNLYNLNALRHLKQLKGLEIFCHDVCDISFLDSLDNLVDFELNSYAELTTFPSSPPKSLRKLKLDNIKNLDLDWLSGWVSLEVLKMFYFNQANHHLPDGISSGPIVIDIGGLETCLNLKKVMIYYAQIMNLKPLANCKKLEKIKVSETCNGWENLTSLPKLQYLNAIFNDGIPDSFSQMKIHRLEIHYYNGVLNLTDEFLKRLKHLEFFYTRLDNILPLQHATELTFLRIVDREIQDIQPLVHLRKLEWLHISGKIEDISPLVGLLKLKYLNLKYNQIVDIEPLSNLLNLEELQLASNKIVDIQPLMKLNKLNILELDDNPISDLELKERLTRWRVDRRY